jgi:hypothetical protein
LRARSRIIKGKEAIAKRHRRREEDDEDDEDDDEEDDEGIAMSAPSAAPSLPSVSI